MFILASLLEDTSPSGSINMMAEFLSLILIFIFILILAFYTTKFVGTSKSKMMSKGNIKFIETTSVGLNQMHIIKVGNQYFLISSSKDGIRMLSELSGEDLITQDFEKYLDNKINKNISEFGNKLINKNNKNNKTIAKEERTNDQEK